MGNTYTPNENTINDMMMQDFYNRVDMDQSQIGSMTSEAEFRELAEQLREYDKFNEEGLCNKFPPDSAPENLTRSYSPGDRTISSRDRLKRINNAFALRLSRTEQNMKNGVFGPDAARFANESDHKDLHNFIVGYADKAEEFRQNVTEKGGRSLSDKAYRSIANPMSYAEKATQRFLSEKSDPYAQNALKTSTQEFLSGKIESYGDDKPKSFEQKKAEVLKQLDNNAIEHGETPPSVTRRSGGDRSRLGRGHEFDHIFEGTGVDLDKDMGDD